MKTLVVDDEASSRLLLESVLRRHGYQVSSFETAEAAWDACLATEFELALLDWVLPGMDGLELCRRIRALSWGDRVMIVLVTSCDRPEDLRQVLDAGADDYVQKPVNPAMLEVRLTVAQHGLAHRLERGRAESALRQAHDELERRVLERTAGLRDAVRMLDHEAEQRAQAEQALRESEENYRSLVENINDVVFSLDAGGTITYISPVVQRMTGYAADMLRGESFDRFVHREDAASLRERWAGTLSGGPQTVQFRLMAKDGRVIHSLASVRAVVDDGRVIGVTGVLSDVSERKALEDRLRLAQKMEVLGQFAGGVAHDFGNLTMVILNASQAALVRLEATDPVREHVALIRHTAEDAASLSRSLLTFAREENLTPAEVQLDQLIADVIPMVRRLLPPEIALRHVAAPDLGPVRVDRNRIEQVLMNLCLNSRDAMQGGGVISIETSEVTVDESLTRGRSWVQSGRHALLKVTDTGCGMDEQTLARVFDPFFTTKSAGKGTGLGLLTVFSTLKQHGGMIEIDSTSGVGTTCRVYLPMAVPREKAPLGVKLTITSAAEQPTVLVVDDSPDVREVMVGYLESMGYPTLEAEDGVHALELLASRWRGVSLVVTDVTMPRMGGRQLFQRCRELYPSLRFVLCSGYADEWADVRPPGAVFLQKPFDSASLQRAIEQVIGAPA